jgi:hypothetical protein
MGIERVTSEVYKGFFRNEDQEKYLIPSRFTLFGRHIVNNTILYCLGIALIIILIAILCIEVKIDNFAWFLTASCCSGIAVALGGAYKDAPFEGFKLINFLKSPLILLFSSPLFYIWGSISLGFLIYMNIGLERFIVEYYKTYVQRSMSGKFSPDIQICQRAVESRGKYHFMSLLIILGLVFLLFSRLRYS